MTRTEIALIFDVPPWLVGEFPRRPWRWRILRVYWRVTKRIPKWLEIA